jgi:hypothetical protein
LKICLLGSYRAEILRIRQNNKPATLRFDVKAGALAYAAARHPTVLKFSIGTGLPNK